MIDSYRALLACCCTVVAVAGFAQESLLQPSQAELIDTLENSEAENFDKAKACQRLAIIGNSEAVQPLVCLLDHPELSVYALTALQRIPGQEAEAALVSAIDDVSGRSLAGLVHAVGQRRIMSAVPKLAELVRPGKTDSPSRHAALRALGRIGGDGAGKILAEIQGQLTGKLDRRIVSDAMQQVGLNLSERIDPTELSRLLVAKDDASFRQGLNLARRIGEQASSIVAKRMDDLGPQRQSLALICLADLGDPAGVPAAKKFLDAEHPQVALRAVQAITKLGGWGEVEYPIQAITKPEIATNVARALADAKQSKFDRVAIEQLAALASEQATSPVPMQQAVIEYARSRRLAAATKALMTIGIHGTPQVRRAALEAVGLTVSGEQFPVVLSRLIAGELTDDDELKTVILQNAMVKLPADATAGVMASELEGADAATKTLLLGQLGFLGGDRALEIACSAARRDDEASVNAATQVLGQWLTADVADPLMKLARELPSGRYQLCALRGYLRVGRQLDMPIDERMQLAQTGYGLANRDDERRLALEIMRRYPCDQGMDWIVKTLSSNQQPSRKLKNAQFVALAHVADRIRLRAPDLVADTLAEIDFSEAPAATRQQLRQMQDRSH